MLTGNTEPPVKATPKTATGTVPRDWGLIDPGDAYEVFPDVFDAVVLLASAPLLFAA